MSTVVFSIFFFFLFLKIVYKCDKKAWFKCKTRSYFPFVSDTKNCHQNQFYGKRAMASAKKLIVQMRKKKERKKNAQEKLLKYSRRKWLK